MHEWVIVLTPLLVLLPILLFRFMGCSVTPEDDMPVTSQSQPPASSVTLPPDETVPYPEYILVESKHRTLLMHYWRLMDPLGSTTAKDESPLQRHDGSYRTDKLEAFGADPDAGASEARNPGLIKENQSSLIANVFPIDADHGRIFDGGHVRVQQYPGLYTEQFTIEAWVRLGPMKADFEYTLFSAGFVYGAPASPRGFRVYVDRGGRWRARLGHVVPTLAVEVLFGTSLPAISGQLTHIAFSVANDPNPTLAPRKVATLYVNATPVSAAVDGYAPPHDAHLFIGVENAALTPTEEVLRTPILSQVQEVVLYRIALPDLEINEHFKRANKS